MATTIPAGPTARRVVIAGAGGDVRPHAGRTETASESRRRRRGAPRRPRLGPAVARDGRAERPGVNPLIKSVMLQNDRRDDSDVAQLRRHSAGSRGPSRPTILWRISFQYPRGPA